MAANIGAVCLGSAARVVPAPRSQPVRAALLSTSGNTSVKSGSPLAVRAARRQDKQRQSTIAQASQTEKDFDSILSDIADKFEKSDKKAAVIGYTAAGVIAFFFSEWLIHLPLLNVLLGFPIQLIGLVLLPYVVVKYAIDGDDYVVDIQNASDRVIKKLPGFEK